MHKKTFTLCIVATIATIYLIMFLNTNSVVKEVRNIMHGHVAKEITAGTPLQRYNAQGTLGTVSAKVKITRMLVLHNFFDGYIWVQYTCEGFDADGNRTYGSWEIPSLWKIHKANGKWEIVNIKEAP